MMPASETAPLPPPWRLALAYAPGSVSAAWAAFLALDIRLAGLVRGAREPLLAQVRYGDPQFAQGRSRREWAQDLQATVSNLCK